MTGEGPDLVERVSEEEAVDEDLGKNENSIMRMMIIPVALSRPNKQLLMLINELS